MRRSSAQRAWGRDAAETDAAGPDAAGTGSAVTAAERGAMGDRPVAAEAIAGSNDVLASRAACARAVPVAPPKNIRLDCWKNASICGRIGVSWGALAKSAGRVVL